MKTRTILHMIVAAMLCLLTSCEHKELCFDHTHREKLRLVFDWRDAPEADPVGMVVFFYPEDPDGETLRVDFDNIKGGDIELPAGKYKVLTYNNDTSGVLFRDTDLFHGHTGFTRQSGLLEPMGITGNTSAMRARGSEDEPVRLCPDMMWGCADVEVNVPPETDNVIYLYPHELTCIYTYEIRNVKNLDLVTDMSATICGMSPELRFHDEELGMVSVTHPIEAYAAADGKTIVGRFITFGHHEDNPDPHKMMLYVRTSEGKNYSFGTDNPAFDVTGQVHSAPDRRRVHLIIDGLEIPADGGDPMGGGFTPGTDDWQSVDIDVEM